MSYRCFAPTAAVITMGVVVLLASSPAVGQALTPAAKTAKAAKAWTPPRTPDGQPNLQGVWTSNSVTPLQRPKGLAEFYTEAEVTAKIKRESERVSQANLEANNIVPDPDDTRTAKGADIPVHYDFSDYGMDRGQSKLAWSRRTSIIVGPEGTIPPLTPAALKRVTERAAKAKGHEFDGPENFGVETRCIVRSGPPMLPSQYNSNWQIVQTSGYVAIHPEMGLVRIIPTDGRPHLAKNIHQWMGDSVGHWEGNTLVVDTTNFTYLYPFADAQNLHVIERLTRGDDDTILYQFTVEDPGMWTRPWSGEIPITRIPGQLYEFACHEGNYGLANTLRGARVAEEEAAKKAAKEDGNR